MGRFSPTSSILATIKMTRTAYAQLMGQKFFPPKVFGSWKEKEGTSEWRWKDIGMKTVGTFLSNLERMPHFLSQAIGFEILYQEGGGKPATSDTKSSVSASAK
jgi:hypothetical protein